MVPRRAFYLAGMALLLLGLVGCGGGDGLSDVSGTVKFKGTPVAAGRIMFTPADGKSAVTGGDIKDGRYSARVPQGQMKVSISMPKVVGKKKLYPTPDSPEMPVTEEALPAKYSDPLATELRLDVNQARVEKDFDL